MLIPTGAGVDAVGVVATDMNAACVIVAIGVTGARAGAMGRDADASAAGVGMDAGAADGSGQEATEVGYGTRRGFDQAFVTERGGVLTRNSWQE